MRNSRQIIFYFLIIGMCLSFYSCAVNLVPLPYIPPKSNIKAKSNLDLYVDSLKIRGMLSSDVVSEAERIMTRYIYNENFFNTVLGVDQAKQKKANDQTVLIKAVITPNEHHEFNWWVSWPAIYPCPGYWPWQAKKGFVSVRLECEVLTNTGDLVTTIDADHSEEYAIDLYGFYRTGDAEAKMMTCYESIFGTLSKKIVADERVVALARSTPKIMFSNIDSYKPQARVQKDEYIVKETNLVSKESTVSFSPEVKGSNFGNYYALIIGNNNYKSLPKLKTAKNDAITIANLLSSDYGFNIQLLIDGTRADIISALNQYRKTLSVNDNFLLFYAGHGWLDEAEDEGYWLPVDASQDDSINWISNANVTRKLKAIEAKHILVVSDSCYSGKLTRGVHVKINTPNYLRKLAEKRARTVMSSGGLEPVSDCGGRGTHSVFATALLDVLKNNKEKVIDTTQLFPSIRRLVMLHADQTPEYSDMRKANHDGGDFLFVRKK